MTVADFLRQLQEFPLDMEIVVGHPRHDRCEQINVSDPEVTEAFKYRDGPWVDQWTVKNETPDNVGEDEEYVHVIVIE
jgi:hypothetical protein